MTWRLIEVGVYSKKDHAVSRVRFNASGMSIVTGLPGRGKSSIINIVDYCLMAGYCHVARGVVRDHAAVVAIAIARGGETVGIFRPLPDLERKESAESAVVVLRDGHLPASAPPFLSNTEATKDAISEFTGIEALGILDDGSGSGGGQPVNIRHCVPMMFQTQTIIGSPTVAFPLLSDNHFRRHFADASSYFLGLLTAPLVRDRINLRELTQERNRVLRQEREAKQLKARGWERGLQLWRAAAGTGLVDGDVAPRSEQALFDGLQSALAKTRQVADGLVAAARLGDVYERERSVRGRLREARFQLSEIEQFQRATNAHDAVSSQQAERLALRDLLPKATSRTCPLCNNGVLDVTAIEDQLREGVAHVQATRVPPKRLASRMETTRRRLTEEAKDLEQQLLVEQAKLSEALEGLQNTRTLLQERDTLSQLAGRIREYVDTVRAPVSAFAESIQRLEAVIADLDRRAGPAVIARQRANVEEAIGDTMGGIARRLGLEFASSKMRLNFDALTIQIELDGRWRNLNEVGSAANHIGYHIAAFCALHLYLADAGCPVPRVLIIDQPSQAWFPTELASEGLAEPTGDVELQAVRNIYAVLDSVAKTPGAPQIIVLDHADLRDRFFQDAVVERWRERGGLIPAAWLPDGGMAGQPALVPRGHLGGPTCRGSPERRTAVTRSQGGRRMGLTRLAQSLPD